MTRTNRIVQFWVNSYLTDKVAFYFELVSFVFTIAASATLAINAVDPDMRMVYPLFFVGSITQVYASIRRGMAWIMLLTIWFACVNMFGWCVAMGYI